MMNRIGTVCILTVAAMLLTGGCGSSFTWPGKPDTTGDTNTPKNPAPVSQIASKTRPVVVIDTSMGPITAELWADKAPITVKNFLAYVDDEHFDGLIFHRVMQGFMIQGGGFDPALNKKPVRAGITNEADFAKRHVRGTLGMARTDDIHSATSQFFINLVNNRNLNHRNKTQLGFGYCVFGEVTSGMDVVDRIARVPVAPSGGHLHAPTTPVLIKSIRRKP